MAKLSDFHPDEVKVVNAEQGSGDPTSAKSAPKLSDFHPDEVTVISSPSEVPKDEGMWTKVMRGVLEGVAWAGNKWDSVTGAPTRAAISAAQKGLSPLEAFGTQFGADPAKAPRGEEIAARAGLSEDKYLKTPFRDINQRSIRVSPAQVGGTAVDILADPTLFIPVGKVLKGAGYVAEKGGQLATKGIVGLGEKIVGEGAAETIRNKAINAISSVPEKDIGRYAAIPKERLATLPEKEPIKNLIDDHVAEIMQQRDIAHDIVNREQNALNTAYVEKINEIKKASTPLEHAKDLVSSVEATKKKIGEMSAIADEALANTSGTVKKKDLLAFLDGIGKSAGVGPNKALIGEKNSAAVQRLYALRQQIANGLPKDIDMPTLRDVLQNVRKDIDFNMLSTEFNEPLNNMRKEFTSKISTVIKDASPEYKAQMDAMSKILDNHDEMVKYFGNEDRALSSLNAIAAGSKSAVLPLDALKDHVKLSGNMQALARVQEFQKARELVEMAKTRDLRPVLFPEQVKSLEQKQALLQGAERLIEPVKRLTPSRTQSVISNMGRMEPSIEDRKALEALQGLTGQNYLEDILDRNAVNAFTKDGTRGSRLTVAGTVLGGALGSAVGHPVAGATIGGQAGLYLDKNAGKLSAKFLDSMKEPGLRVPNSIQILESPSTTKMLEAFKSNPTKGSTKIPFQSYLKGAQIYESTTDEHAQRREAVKRRIKRGED